MGRAVEGRPDHPEGERATLLLTEGRVRSFPEGSAQRLMAPR